MKRLILATIILLESVFMAPQSAISQASQTYSPTQALGLLKAGNDRFATSQPDYPNQSSERRAQVSGQQTPFATIITCADSRIAPELVFDQGLGDLFVLRVAGNIVTETIAGSADLGIGLLSTPLVLVMGHTSCQAVIEAIKDRENPGHLPDFMFPVKPAVETTCALHPNLAGAELLKAAIKQNVFQSIEDLFAQSPKARELAASGAVKIEGAYYDLESGKVEWMGQHPNQAELLKADSDAKPFAHVVYFWTKEETTPKQVQQLMDDCKTYLGTIKTVRHLEVGTPAHTPRDVVDNSYAVCLIVHFDSKEDHDYYQSAQKHLDFIERNKDIWERVQVYDMVK